MVRASVHCLFGTGLGTHIDRVPHSAHPTRSRYDNQQLQFSPAHRRRQCLRPESLLASWPRLPNTAMPASSEYTVTGPTHPLKGWKACLLYHSITPIQAFAYTSGKNSTDGAMIIDAMDLLYTGCFSSFCIVSSDSDFTRLASRIREQGVTVYGFGERKTNMAFIAACDKFTYFDVLNIEPEEPQESFVAPQAPRSMIVRLSFVHSKHRSRAMMLLLEV